VVRAVSAARQGGRQVRVYVDNGVKAVQLECSPCGAVPDDYPQVDSGRDRVPVGVDDGAHPLESQKVVAVMSAITKAGRRLMAATRVSRTPGLFVTSISLGSPTTTRPSRD
jgi:hypothetical protein